VHGFEEVQCGVGGGGGGGGVGGNRMTGAPGGLILTSFGAANAALNDETARRLAITKIRWNTLFINAS
jgi:hypothetical protein